MNPEIKNKILEKKLEKFNIIHSVANHVISILILNFDHCTMDMQVVNIERNLV